MKLYVGTKIIQAELATRGECYKGPEMLSSAQAKEPGYKVIYPDGYESWSPKEVFEKAYRENNNLTFGLALEALKMGKKIARNGWNGKGQFIELATSVSYMNPDGEMQNVNHEQMGNKAVAFVGTSGVQLGWLASQADMLSEDWYIVE